MIAPKFMLLRPLYALLLCFVTAPICALAQQPAPTPSSQDDEVLRINTDLVQTDVMVFDKSGQFVDNLKREQFELRVDGKPQAISFFDRVTAGSASEEAQLAAARGIPRPAQEQNQGSVGVLDRGRIIVFFIDDLHLTIDSLRRTQKTLLHFINDEMGQNDQVAISAASGQIGFLQQLTNNKTVLRTAVERLTIQPQQMPDGQRPPMSEFLAQAITALRDVDVINYYKEQLIKDGVPPQAAEQLVLSRAQQIIQQATAFTRNTFFSLEGLARTIAPLSGRKLVFYISDGFLLNTNESDVQEKLTSVTNLAARNGVVIYTMDARGLALDPSMDASSPGTPDATGRIQRAQFGELTASQEGLRTLAANTGGRALLNSNALNAGITKTLKETGTYYVIAWRPETEGQKTGKLHRIEVSIKGQSGLSVQVKRGFLNPPKESTSKPATTQKASSKVVTPADQLRTAINSFYPSAALPTALALDYQDIPQTGAVLNAWMEVQADKDSFVAFEGKYRATIDVSGVVYNDKGQPGANFQTRIAITADSIESMTRQQRSAYYNSQLKLTPGLYQVRVAARDEKTGRIGSTTQWIEIPDLTSHKLAMSSLLVGETTAGDSTTAGDASAPKATLNVARSFARTSRLRFVTFVYNAARGATGTASPDVAIMIQVRRDDQPVLTTALRKIETEGVADLARLPYAAEIPLNNMSAGRYLLQVTVIDRTTKTSALQRIDFEIE